MIVILISNYAPKHILKQSDFIIQIKNHESIKAHTNLIFKPIPPTRSPKIFLRLVQT